MPLAEPGVDRKVRETFKRKDHSPKYRCRNSPEPNGSGGGSSDVLGFPTSGHAHNAIGQNLRVSNIGSRTHSTGQYPRE